MERPSILMRFLLKFCEPVPSSVFSLEEFPCQLSTLSGAYFPRYFLLALPSWLSLLSVAWSVHKETRCNQSETCWLSACGWLWSQTMKHPPRIFNYEPWISMFSITPCHNNVEGILRVVGLVYHWDLSMFYCVVYKWKVAFFVIPLCSSAWFLQQISKIGNAITQGSGKLAKGQSMCPNYLSIS